MWGGGGGEEKLDRWSCIRVWRVWKSVKSVKRCHRTFVHDCSIQLFRQRLSHKSVKAYAKMSIGIMGRKSLVLVD